MIRTKSPSGSVADSWNASVVPVPVDKLVRSGGVGAPQTGGLDTVPPSLIRKVFMVDAPSPSLRTTVTIHSPSARPAVSHVTIPVRSFIARPGGWVTSDSGWVANRKLTLSPSASVAGIEKLWTPPAVRPTIGVTRLMGAAVLPSARLTTVVVRNEESGLLRSDERVQQLDQETSYGPGPAYV